MKMSRRRVVLILMAVLLVFLLLQLLLPPLLASSGPQTPPQQVTVLSAFSAIATAEKEGANVTGLVNQLNSVIDSSRDYSNSTGADYQDNATVQSQLNSIAFQAQQLGTDSSVLGRTMDLQAMIVVSGILVSGVLGYFVFRDAYWLLWLRTKKGWRVKA